MTIWHPFKAFPCTMKNRRRKKINITICATCGKTLNQKGCMCSECRKSLRYMMQDRKE